MSNIQAIVLGIVQGLTEFLPVSSSGHLQLVPWLFGWDLFDGDEDLETAFDVAVHLGTLVGVVAYFWREILRYSGAGLAMVVRREPSRDGRTAWLLIATMIPASIVGLLGGPVLDALDDQIWLTALTLIGFGLLLLLADRMGGTRTEHTFGWRDAAALGLAQACALQPGVSRSGVTVTAARALRFDRSDAARLVFLMSIPVIAAAGAYSFVDIGGVGGIPDDFRTPFVLGMLSSAVTGWLAVFGMLRFVRTHDFTPFVIYRVALGLFVLTLLATGVR
jgi:undecaprenyl-diphosphatase